METRDNIKAVLREFSWSGDMTTAMEGIAVFHKIDKSYTEELLREFKAKTLTPALLEEYANKILKGRVEPIKKVFYKESERKRRNT